MGFEHLGVRIGASTIHSYSYFPCSVMESSYEAQH
jgi:hypothetical protein